MNPSTAPFLNSPPCFLNLCRSLCPNLCRICHPPLRPILPNPSFAASSTPTSISAPPKAPALSRNSPRAPTLPRTCASKPSKNSPTGPNPLAATASLASGAPSPAIALARTAQQPPPAHTSPKKSHFTHRKVPPNPPPQQSPRTFPLGKPGPAKRTQVQNLAPFVKESRPLQRGPCEGTHRLPIDAAPTGER